MRDNRTPPTGGSMARRGPLMVYLAALVTLAGIPIHLYWALGGTWGLPGGAASAGLPGVHATNAIVSVLLAVGAALLFGLTKPWARLPPALVLLTPMWLGSVVSVSHGLYGMVTKGLYVAGAHSAVSYPEPLTAAQKNHAALLDLGVFEPWFLIQGLCLSRLPLVRAHHRRTAHALAAGITRGFLTASAIALAGLVITAITIRIRREDLAGTPEPAQDQPGGAEPALEQARS